MTKFWKIILPLGLAVAALGVLTFSALGGNSARGNGANRSLDDQALDIGKELQCPICQNIAVAYSPSPLAAQMRQIIRSKLQAGETREQILQYFVDRYGEGILWDPPQYGWNLIAWRLPIIALIAGAIGLFWLFRTWRRSQPAEPAAPIPPDDAGAYDALLDAELERRTREVWE